MRLIDADYAKTLWSNDSNISITMRQIFDALPTIDAVHAAGGCYCRECRWHCNCKIEYHGQFGPNSFCCAGEPKEAAHEVLEP